jgi:hypothetical protein
MFVQLPENWTTTCGLPVDCHYANTKLLAKNISVLHMIQFDDYEGFFLYNPVSTVCIPVSVYVGITLVLTLPSLAKRCPEVLLKVLAVNVQFSLE